jgi:hypothetical protein
MIFLLQRLRYANTFFECCGQPSELSPANRLKGRHPCESLSVLGLRKG